MAPRPLCEPVVTADFLPPLILIAARIASCLACAWPAAGAAHAAAPLLSRTYLCPPFLTLSPFFQSFPGRFSSPALRREVALRLLTTLRGIPQVAGACVIGWLEKPFRLECERPITPPPRSQDFQHCMCSQPSPNAGPSVLRVSHLGLAPR